MREEGPLWLLPEGGLPSDELEGWIEWWRAREDGLRQLGPAEFSRLVVELPRDLPAGIHAQLDRYLPWGPLVRAVHSLLLSWFGSSLERLGVELEEGELAQSSSWLEARRRLPGARRVLWPSELLEELRAPERAHEFLFEMFAAPCQGAELGRYPEQLAELAAHLPHRPLLRGWDAGTATGEGAWELAQSLLAKAERVEVLGTNRCPLAHLMAKRQARPHDELRTATLRCFLSGEPALQDAKVCQVRFARHDLLEAPPAGPFDVITCHGVLGESIAEPEAISRVVASLAGALASGGVLSITDRFRHDRTRSARARVALGAAQSGLTALGGGLFQTVARGIGRTGCNESSRMLG